MASSRSDSTQREPRAADEAFAAASSGDSQVARLLPLVYDELRRLADQCFQYERHNHTLQPTALVHEAYIRLAGQDSFEWRNRKQFFAVAATFMRRILVNHAKRRGRLKRGGGRRPLTLDTSLVGSETPQPELLALDEALGRLAEADARKARVVELRYFAGLSIEEVAEVLAISSATVKRDWLFAKAWLLREISEDQSDREPAGD